MARRAGLDWVTNELDWTVNRAELGAAVAVR
jgi:hypothetical protein